MRISTLVLGAATFVAIGAITAASAQSIADAENPASASAAPMIGVGDADGAFVASGSFREPDGEKLYRRVCAACHMGQGEGAIGAGFYPALADNEKMAAGAYPAYVVINGLNGMPSFAGMMTDQQVADVVNYVRTHFGNEYPEPIGADEVAALR